MHGFVLRCWIIGNHVGINSASKGLKTPVILLSFTNRTHPERGTEKMRIGRHIFLNCWDAQILERQKWRQGANHSATLLRHFAIFSARRCKRFWASRAATLDVVSRRLSSLSGGDDVAGSSGPLRKTMRRSIALGPLQAFDHLAPEPANRALRRVEGSLEFGQYAVAGGFHEPGPVIFGPIFLDRSTRGGGAL